MKTEASSVRNTARLVILLRTAAKIIKGKKVGDLDAFYGELKLVKGLSLHKNVKASLDALIEK